MPCDYKNYPVNWKSEIRPAILERDNHCCKFCGVENYSHGYRDKDGNWITEREFNGLKSDIGDFLFNGKFPKRIQIILTIMHLDHNTKNNDYGNLAAGCQKCHLNYDKDHHRKNTRQTIKKKKGLQELFPNQQVK